MCVCVWGGDILGKFVRDFIVCTPANFDLQA
jgi:hypothetical protein